MAANFGHSIRKEFLLNFDLCPINHGSWGTIPKKVMDKKLELQHLMESNPDHWFRRLFEDMWNENTDAAAEFLGANKDNLVLVPNATAGVNTIMKSLPLTSKDGVLINSWTYNAIKNACHAAISRAGGELLTLKMSIPISSPEEIVDKYKKFLEDHPSVKITVIDYISSATATFFPIRELTALCKEYGVMVLIDGAHSPGHVDVNLEEMGKYGVDFYVGNFHKWVFCPRSCAGLWVHPRHHSIVRPLVTGHFYQKPRWRDDFCLQGTLDHTPYLCTKDAIAFYNEIGGFKEISNYNRNLVDKAADMLAEKWKTERFPISKELEAPNMKLVRIPDIPKYPIPEQMKTRPFGDSDLHTALFHDYNITTTTLFVEGERWVRISGQIYNTMDDYEKLANAVLDLQSKS